MQTLAPTTAPIAPSHPSVIALAAQVLATMYDVHRPTRDLLEAAARDVAADLPRARWHASGAQGAPAQATWALDRACGRYTTHQLKVA